MSWTKADVPFFDQSVDPSRGIGRSAQTILSMVLGVAVLVAVMAGGQRLYNEFANRTPDAVQQVEVF